MVAGNPEATGAAAVGAGDVADGDAAALPLVEADCSFNTA
jgi:hypothetical protein